MVFTRKEWQPALRAVKKYLPFSILLFLLSFLGGVLFVNFYPSIAEESLQKLTEAFSFLFDLGPAEMGVFIFFNNLIKIFLFMLLGVLFAVPTVFFLILNGWVLGYVAALTYGSLGLRGLFFGLCLHGIFELSALFIGASLGIWLGVSFYQEAKRKKVKIFPLSSAMKSYFFSAMGIFVRIVIPLLFIAAVVETLIIFFYDYI